MWITVLGFARKLTPMGWVALALLGVVIAAMGTCTVNKVTSHFDRNDAVKTNNADRELREDLSGRRQETETRITATEARLNATLDALPDTIPSQRRLARACDELRDDGYTVLPVECRSATDGTTPR